MCVCVQGSYDVGSSRVQSSALPLQVRVSGETQRHIATRPTQVNRKPLITCIHSLLLAKRPVVFVFFPTPMQMALSNSNIFLLLLQRDIRLCDVRPAYLRRGHLHCSDAVQAGLGCLHERAGGMGHRYNYIIEPQLP